MKVAADIMKDIDATVDMVNSLEVVRAQVLTLKASLGDDPKTSVTDRFCRLHDVKNVYLADAAPFVSGGTQANRIALGAMLKPYESVIAAESAHIQVHEAGAIESTGLTAYKAGSVVVEEGAPGDSLYVITRGALEVTTKSPDGHPVRVGTLVVGDFFGEVSLLTGKPRAATVRAESVDVLMVLLG